MTKKVWCISTFPSTDVRKMYHENHGKPNHGVTGEIHNEQWFLCTINRIVKSGCKNVLPAEVTYSKKSDTFMRRAVGMCTFNLKHSLHQLCSVCNSTCACKRTTPLMMNEVEGKKCLILWWCCYWVPPCSSGNHPWVCMWVFDNTLVINHSLETHHHDKEHTPMNYPHKMQRPAVIQGLLQLS